MIAVMKAFVFVCIAALLVSVSVFAEVSKDHDAVEGVSLNIHVSVGASVEKEVYALGKCLEENGIENMIGWDWAVPHVTLYLTEFKKHGIWRKAKLILDVVRGTMKGSHLRACDVTVMPTASLPIHSYGMLKVQKSQCLQSLSDNIVQATKGNLADNYTIPAWIDSLPDGKTKNRKKELAQKYHSPNVFDQFQPHITFAWVKKEQIQLMQKLVTTTCRSTLDKIVFRVRDVSLSKSGKHGTALRNSSFFSIPLFLP
eukprot:Nk52_evm89s151 gene=Nk52_evmTU89s151